MEHDDDYCAECCEVHAIRTMFLGETCVKCARHYGDITKETRLTQCQHGIWPDDVACPTCSEMKEGE